MTRFTGALDYQTFENECAFVETRTGNHTVPHQHVEPMQTNKETLKRNQDMLAGFIPGSLKHLLKCLRFQV